MTEALYIDLRERAVDTLTGGMSRASWWTTLVDMRCRIAARFFIRCFAVMTAIARMARPVFWAIDTFVAP